MNCIICSIQVGGLVLLRCATHSLRLHGLVVKGLNSTPKGSEFKTYTGHGSFVNIDNFIYCILLCLLSCKLVPMYWEDTCAALCRMYQGNKVYALCSEICVMNATFRPVASTGP